MNYDYLPLAVMDLAREQMTEVNSDVANFQTLYREANGDPDKLSPLLDIQRDRAIRKLRQYAQGVALWADDEKVNPSRIHLRMLLWAYSPNPVRACLWVEEKGD